MLPSEMKAIELNAAKQIPKFSLGIGGLGAKAPGKSF
jgi:hypothetical protein